MGDACDADDDNDGIFDDVDPLPTTYSNGFTDLGTGGTTSGTLNRGDQVITITEESNPLGVKISATLSGGSTPSVVEACVGAVQLHSFSPGTEITVTCGSVILTVVSGTVEVAFIAQDGTRATTSLSAGNGLTFHPVEATVTVPPTNTELAVIVVDGKTVTVAPGNTASVTNDPPVANAGLDQTVIAAGTATAITLNGSGSSDPDGNVLTYTWTGSFGTASGVNPVIALPPGSHTITLTVNDGQVSASDKVVINVVYAFGGFLTPLAENSRTDFHLGSVVPVKFQLTNASGAALTSAVARITLQKVSGDVPVGDPIDGVSVSSADSGNLFRVNGDKYSFNLSTKSLSTGTWRIQAVLDDGTVHSIQIGLTKK